MPRFWEPRAFAYEADLHCLDCASAAGMTREDAEDEEGNPVGVVFHDADIPDEGEHCGTCGAVISAPPSADYVASLADSATEAAVECVLWLGYVLHEGEPPEREDLRDCDVTAHDRAEITRALGEFVADLPDETQRALYEIRDYYTPEQFGHDWVLSTNGHGAGFFDRHPLKDAGIADVLQRAARGYAGPHAWVDANALRAARDGGPQTYFYVSLDWGR